ncbi:hypothetical protein XELAEV_18006557mg [Xenopus laevis]|uniref:Uncharacterized protein n=1 Tax=Xenopus laevis TaxID=8355 RepID=A0A974DZU6_XENLA|nr:hypothetical protein XELAEV_18006557mg [Xenopus laevis]
MTKHFKNGHRRKGESTQESDFVGKENVFQELPQQTVRKWTEKWLRGGGRSDSVNRVKENREVTWGGERK